MIEEIKIQDFTIKIDYCEVDWSPIEEEGLINIYHWHSKYNLGEQIYQMSLEDFKNEYEDADDPFAIICPLHMMDHSGVSLSIGEFGCRWDSGQVGYVTITKSALKDACLENTKELKLKEFISDRIDTFQKYLNGSVYGFTIEKNGEFFDDCSGYFDIKFCKEEALSRLADEFHNALKKINEISNQL